MTTPAAYSTTDTRSKTKPPKSRCEPFRVTTDPWPEGPLCIVSGCENVRTPIAVAHGDPFCSSRCCAIYYDAATVPH